MKSLRSILALCAFFVLGVGIAACGSGVPGDAVANMAGNPVSTQAFNHWMYVAAKGNASQSPGAPVIVPTDPPDFKQCVAQVRKQIPSLAKTPDKQLKGDCQQLFTSLSSQVMDFLIKAYWYQAQAAKYHIKVTDAQVQQAFNTAKNQQFHTEAAFQQFLNQTGQTLPDILFRVRVNQIYRKLLARNPTNVTAAQIQTYYNTHKGQFGQAESRTLRIIRTKTLQQANAAKAALASGQSWAVVAKKYSVDNTTKNHGGLVPGVTKGQEEQALDKVVFSASVKKVYGPVKGQFGFYVFEVVSIRPASQQSLAKATPIIRQILSSESQSNAQTAVDNAAKKAWLKQTKCRSGYAMADCAGYKPPKTSTTTAPTTTPPPATTTTR